MTDVWNGELHLIWLVWHKRFRLFKTLSKLSTEDIAADQLLIAPHANSSGIVFRIRVVVGIDINQLYHPVRIRSTR